MKLLALIAGGLLIVLLFFLSKTLNKPIYSKMHNVWHDDPYGRTIADGCIVIMLLMAFLLGLII